MLEHIQWLGHGSFLVLEPKVIYIDPWKVPSNAFHPDAILISHDHYDHCSTADIQRLSGPDTRIVCNERVASQIEHEATILRPWQSITLDRVSVKAIPAYSQNGSLHPLSHGGLGFIISANYFDIYYAGDTKIIAEMEKIHPDIALLPIDNNDTLSIADAVEVIRIIRPKWVIPYNWGNSGLIQMKDLHEFKTLVGELAQVIIPRINERLSN